MKLKAIKKWDNEKVLIKPILFTWNVGIQFKILTGIESSSIFCMERKEFVFPIQTKILIGFVYLWYLMYELCYWQTKRKILYWFRTKGKNKLPF